MTTTPLRRLVAAITLCLATGLPAAESAAPAPKVESLGNSTYSVTVSATHKFTRNTEKLKTQATAAASAYCAAQGKQLKIVKVDENKSFYGIGEMAHATITFKALDPSDPEFTAATPGATTTPTTAISNEALYADLLRLDDLRKKGILTDEEFAAEKKKVLARSK